MINLQHHVTAMRKGELSRITLFYDAVTTKYNHISGDDLTFEEIFQLMIFELLQTNLSEKDIESVNTFYNYTPITASGFLPFSLSVFMEASLVVLTIKKNAQAAYPSIVQNTKLTSAQSIAAFSAVHSPFSKLIARVSREQSIHEALYQQLDETQYQNRIDRMQEAVYQRFQKDCLQQNKLEQRQHQLKTALKDYKDHLLKKMELYGVVIISKDQFIMTDNLEEKPARITKLITRYKAISELNLDEMDLNMRIAIEAVRKAIETCMDNSPSWYERGFLKAVTDILSIGIKPIIRFFVSKENQFKDDIAGLTSAMHDFKNR